MTDLGEARASLARGRKVSRWPVFVFVLIMLAATIYAFSPRALPPFPPTGVHANDLLVTGVARQGKRVLAVGELGQILWADSATGPWHVARVTPQHGLTFTNVAFVGPRTAIAVGHGAVIVRSDDDGKSWRQVSYLPKLGDALMGVSGPFDGKLFAYGAFGLLEVSTDNGRSWDSGKFNITPLPTPAPSASAANSGNPFANYVQPDDPSTHHIYGITQLADGELLLVGERGLIALSSDHGVTWTQQPKVYPGSYFGVLKPTRTSVLIYGLGGHVFLSTDGARTWMPSTLPQPISMYGGTVLPDGRVVLVGNQETILVSRDGGRSFTRVSQADRGNMDSVLALGAGQLLAAGMYGVQVKDLAAPAVAATTGAGP
ncbi:MAG TPA: hypothetical protein VFQ88_16235 [Nevskiaceae bacterium]|nr:hypothetical protein [Nevskiaceae bacterium]